MAEQPKEEEPTVTLTGEQLGNIILHAHNHGFNKGRQATNNLVQLSIINGPHPNPQHFFDQCKAQSLLEISEAIKRNVNE